MIKKNLFKNLILLASIISSVVMVGCATNNVATNDTEVGVEVVDASDVIADENEENVENTTGAVESTVEAAKADETVEVSDVEKTSEGKVVASSEEKEDSKTNASVAKDSSANKESATSNTNDVKTSAVKETTTANNSSKAGSVVSSKPSSVPSNVPASATTPKPVVNSAGSTTSVAKESVNVKPTESQTTASNKGGNSTSGSNKDYGWVDSYGVRHGGYATQEEANAAGIADTENRKKNYTTTVTVNNGVTDAMNKYREENGKAAVSSNDYLDEKAKTRAEEIAKDFTHNSASGLTGQENIQANYGGGATNEQVVENYSESYGHNGTMLDDYQSASSATATVTDADGNVVAQYDVTVFDDFNEDAVEVHEEGFPEWFDPSWMN